MNPHDELQRLITLFPEEDLYQSAVHVPASTIPAPYKRMLVHDHHMTVTMEEYHGCPVTVEVLDNSQQGNVYTRKILLRRSTDKAPVQFGIVRFNFDYVTPEVRDEIIAGQIPLGRVLITHNVLRHIDLGAIIEFTAGAGLAKYLDMPVGDVTYGRMATIFCNRRPAVDLLEISSPLGD